ncbi:chromate transporter [Caldisalinibacter kiritimatiensis]|uniref:Chromate transport protein n=1 Tax=Caldisalinibacter kiritimatiensis TaxID=1304284 RepID=R1ASK7_9FIRM|nr:chromate transporter [Caldisalinibacter kiritimatiensis]EOD00143.1 Chromate transport protein [Caldisalinibacter kiritimatiensis]
MKKQQIKLLFNIFITFFKIGCFTFGGGYAMIPLIQREFVDNKGWVKEEEIVDVFAIAQTVPGAIAINSSSFVGYKIANRKGAIVATLGVVLPSFLIIVSIAMFFIKFQNHPIVDAIFQGVRPAVVALILAAAIKVGKTSIKDITGAAIAVVSGILVIFVNVNVIFIIILGAVIGVTIYKFLPNKAHKIMAAGSDKGDIC